MLVEQAFSFVLKKSPGRESRPGLLSGLVSLLTTESGTFRMGGDALFLDQLERLGRADRDAGGFPTGIEPILALIAFDGFASGAVHPDKMVGAGFRTQSAAYAERFLHKDDAVAFTARQCAFGAGFHTARLRALRTSPVAGVHDDAGPVAG